MQGPVDDSVRFDLLGPLRAFRGQRELDLGPAKQRAVLAILLLAANRPVPTGRIIDAVWGDEPPENGTNVVQKYVAGLRRVLEPERAPRSAGLLLTLTEAGYRLSVAPGNTDLDLFTSNVREARQLRDRGRLAEAAAELQTALSLWRAEPLAGLTGSYFDATRARLTDDRAAAVEDWAELELEQGHQQNLLPELSRLVAEFPLHERLRGLQMLALYRAGRQAEALATYREARTLLVNSHGVEPGSALQNLHQQVLQNDPALTTPQSSPDPSVQLPQPAPQYWPPAAPVQGGQPETLRWQDWALKFAAAAVPIISVGMLSGPLVGLLAIRRRSVRLGAAAVGYLAVTLGGALLIDTSTDEITSDSDGFGVVLVIASALVCAVHVAVIVPRRKRTPEIDPRRQYARQLAAEHPQIARQLGIGRPDLPNRFEDGGLIDINDAPEPVLRTLPGVSAEQAALIVADRTHRGTFHSFEDLSARGLFPAPIPPQVADVLLIIRVQDTVDGDRR